MCRPDVHTFGEAIDVESVGYTLRIAHNGVRARVIRPPMFASDPGNVIIHDTTLAHAVQHVASIVALDMALEVTTEDPPPFEFWCPEGCQHA